MGGTIIKTLKKEFTFEFITFNGENMTEVLSFISLNRLNSSNCILDDYEKRPKDIPNLNYGEWNKDEFFKVDMKLNKSGYMRLVFFKKGDTIIYCDKMELDDEANFIILDGPMTEEKIKKYIEDHYGI